MQVMSFCPLAHGTLPVLQDPTIKAIAQRYSKSPAQVILRWLIQESIIPVVKSTDTRHLKENLAIFDFVLDSTDMDQIRSLDRSSRVGFNPNLIA